MAKPRRTLETMTKSQLIKVLDRVFSEYVRLSAADEQGYCSCVTCGAIYHWKDIDCGHFISRSVHATRFSEMNCHPQCRHENRFRQGVHHIYRQRLIDLYGEEEVKALENTAMIGGSYTAEGLRLEIIEYREKVKALKKG